MNDENDNNMNNNMQNNPGMLPGLDPQPINESYTLPGMDNNLYQNPNQQYENELGINMEPNMGPNMGQDQMNTNPYQLNSNMNQNPYGNMDMQFGNSNQEINNQFPSNNIYQATDPNMNSFNNTMNEQMPNNPYTNMGGMPPMDYGNINVNMGQQFNAPGMNMNTEISEPMAGQTYPETNSANGDIETEFTKAWMGGLYEKSINKKFNWCAALFGATYLIYRKIYLTGVIVFLFQIVAIIAGMILSVKMPMAGMVVSIVTSLGLFIGLGLGFYGLYRNYVKGKLQKFSAQTSDTNQLLSLASQKGGVSVPGAIIEIIVSSCIVPLIITLLITAGIVTYSTMGSSINTNTVTPENEVEEEEIDNTSVFEFDNDYSLVYDMNEWYLDETNKTLTKGNYTLAYATKFSSQQCGFDLSSADGRAGLLKYMIDSFSAQVQQSSMQIDTGNSNFIPQNNRYYNYMDFIAGNQIERYYFVVLPEHNMLLQFTLGINDTSIDDQTNIEIIDMLTNIEKTDSSTQDGSNNTDNNLVDGSNEIDSEVSNALSNYNQNTNLNGNSTNVTENTVPATNATLQSGNTSTTTNANNAQQTNTTTSATLSQYIQ